MAFQAKVDVLINFVSEFGEQSSIPQVPYKYSFNRSSLVAKKGIDIQVNNTAKVVWDGTTDTTTGTFSFLFLISDVEVDLEFTANEGDANEELFTVRLAPNAPLILGDDASYFNHMVNDAFGGTLDVINKIRVQEINAVTANLKGWICS